VKPETKSPELFRFAIRGWIAGGLTTLALGLIWPIIFPAILRINHYYGVGPGLPVILLIMLALVTPPALLGGFVGGRVAREGGQSGQRMAAVIGGIIAAVPFGCGALWFFTGW
jgi:hypothetical protein